jgi:hypothetical protein
MQVDREVRASRLDQPVNLEALVRAIAVASLDEPETDALEWKGAVELTSTATTLPNRVASTSASRPDE